MRTVANLSQKALCPRWLFVTLLLLFAQQALFAATNSLVSLAPDLPVTSGLIRWWPNLFDVRDEITGGEGTVMGLLPAVQTGSNDETEFGWDTGWVQLRPAITNEVFTITFWVYGRFDPRTGAAILIGQESARDAWFLYFEGPLPAEFQFIVCGRTIRELDREQKVRFTEGAWHHLAITRKPGGSSAIWVDGVRQLEIKTTHPWPTDAEWLTVGSHLSGPGLFHGKVRDLCVFERLLEEDEIRAFFAAGVPTRPARNSPARRAATETQIETELQTNVVHLGSERWVDRRFTTEDGLPDNAIYSLLQTRNGYLWVGTQEGIARFDGKRFRSFTASDTDALKQIGDDVLSLSEDEDGTIWAGMYGGLLRIRDLKFTAFTNGLPQLFVLQAEPAGDGSLWVAGFDLAVPRGPLRLRRYHPQSQTSSAEVIVPGHIRRLQPVMNGVWMATEQPSLLLFWDGVSPAPSVVASFGSDFDSKANARVGGKALPPNLQLRLWAPSGTDKNWVNVRLGGDGLDFTWIWDPRLQRPWTTRWSGKPIAGEIWMGVSKSLSRLQRGILEQIPWTSEALSEITCLTANRESGVWFGTGQDGLHLLQEQPVRMFTTREGLTGNDVRSISVTEDGRLWVATPEGLSLLQGNKSTSHGAGNIRSVVADSAGRPWFGLAEGGHIALQRDSSEPGRNLVLPGLEWQHPNSVRFARDGKLWIVCERGLTWMDPRALQRQPDGNWFVDKAIAPDQAFGRFAVGKELPEIFPIGVVEGADGSIWMGSLNGGGLWNLKNGALQSFGAQDGLPGEHWVPLKSDATGALWVTTDAGLTRRKNGRFQTITPAAGYPRDLIFDLIEDDLGYFWLSGKRGIHRVSRRTIEEFFDGRTNHVRSVTLGTRDGMLTPECSSMHYPTMAKTPDGHIWVATRNGLATFDPRSVTLDSQALPAEIEQVVVNGREFPLPVHSGPLKLPAGSGEKLEIRFAAVSLTAADKIQFRYRLDPDDEGYSAPTGLRLAFYTNLRPGEYTFRVKACNAHGVWNEDDTVLSFVIQPFFWETKAFYGCLLAAALAGATAFHRYRLRLERSKEELRLQQALLDEKTRIAEDMHDELGATLTQIAILGEIAKTQTNPAETHTILTRISQAARDVTSGMSELVWATNPRNDTLENLAAHLREMAAAQLQDTSLSANLEFPATLPQLHVSALLRRNLVLILREALHNVVKHANGTEVSVTLSANEVHMDLIVADNGKGFVPGAAPRGNGLGNMSKRAADLGGVLSVQSVPGRGTTVSVSIHFRQSQQQQPPHTFVGVV